MSFYVIWGRKVRKTPLPAKFIFLRGPRDWFAVPALPATEFAVAEPVEVPAAGPGMDEFCKTRGITGSGRARGYEKSG